jgi:hypothetical protein
MAEEMPWHVDRSIARSLLAQLSEFFICIGFHPTQSSPIGAILKLAKKKVNAYMTMKPSCDAE